jgi:hypothetical protein
MGDAGCAYPVETVHINRICICVSAEYAQKNEEPQINAVTTTSTRSSPINPSTLQSFIIRPRKVSHWRRTFQRPIGDNYSRATGHSPLVTHQSAVRACWRGLMPQMGQIKYSYYCSNRAIPTRRQSSLLKPQLSILLSFLNHCKLLLSGNQWVEQRASDYGVEWRGVAVRGCGKAKREK